MEQGVDADAESKLISVLKVLSKSSEPIGSITIDCIGVIQIGGLYPVAATVETGIDIENIAESGLIDYNQLQNFSKL